MKKEKQFEEIPVFSGTLNFEADSDNEESLIVKHEIKLSGVTANLLEKATEEEKETFMSDLEKVHESFEAIMGYLTDCYSEGDDKNAVPEA